MFARAQSKKVMLCMLFLVGFLAYSSIISSFFLSDDFAQIGKVLRGDLSVMWGREYGGFFRPVFILSYAVDVAIWRRSPLGFHVTNLVLQIFNSCLVWLIAQSLARESNLNESQQKSLSVASGLIFLLHPAHTEAVSWISGRADLLAALGSLTALLLFINYVRGRGRAYLFAAMFAVALGLLSKEAAICFPLLALLTSFYLRRSLPVGAAFKQAINLTLPFIVLVALYVAVRAAVLGTLIGGYGAGQHLNVTHGVIISQLLRFSLRLIFPITLLRHLTFLESRAMSPILIVTGVIVLIVSAVALRKPASRSHAIAWGRSNSFPWLLLTLTLAALLPAINLRINIFTTQGERYLYLASAFFATAMAYFLIRAARGNEKLRAALIVCLLAFYAGSLWLTNRTWREASMLSRTILNDVVRQSTRGEILMLNAPDNLRGAYVYRNGFEEALQSFQDSKQLRSTGIVAFQDLETRTDEVILQRDADVLSLRLTNPRTSFYERVAAQQPCVTIPDNSGGVLRLRLNDCGRAFDIFVVSAGQAVKVGEGP